MRVDVEQWPDLPPWEVVRLHDAAAVLPLLPDDRVLLVKQFRPAVRQVLTEIPAGILDVDGEDALTAAARELEEETGYRHTSDRVPRAATTHRPARLDQYVHLFWARVAPEPVGAVGRRHRAHHRAVRSHGRRGPRRQGA